MTFHNTQSMTCRSVNELVAALSHEMNFTTPEDDTTPQAMFGVEFDALPIDFDANLESTVKNAVESAIGTRINSVMIMDRFVYIVI